MALRARITTTLLVAVLLAACSTSDPGPVADQVEPSPDDSSAASSLTGEPTEAESQIDKGPTPTQRADPDLDRALIEAAWDNDVPRAARLIARGARVDWRDETGQSAFLIASSEGYLTLLNLTLDHDPDLDLHDSFDGTALIRAAERGHWPIVGRLLQTAIARDHVNNLGWVALHEAIILGDGTQPYVTTVQALVAGGADLKIEAAVQGAAPLELATQRAQTAVADTLRRALAASPPTNPQAALLAAAARGDADGVAISARLGADLESRDRSGRTPLLLAVTHDHLDVARLLVALGASPDALDDRHDTPWLVTGVTGSVPMAELLLAYGPDLRLRNRYGGVSLIPAAERGHVDYVRRVARTGIDVNHVNDLGWTALLEAIILGDGTQDYVDIVQILLGAGADPTIGDAAGVSPREHAVRLGHRRIAALLLQ